MDRLEWWTTTLCRPITQSAVDKVIGSLHRKDLHNMLLAYLIFADQVLIHMHNLSCLHSSNYWLPHLGPPICFRLNLTIQHVKLLIIDNWSFFFTIFILTKKWFNHQNHYFEINPESVHQDLHCDFHPTYHQKSDPFNDNVIWTIIIRIVNVGFIGQLTK